jgi:hypothetical protein
VSENIFYVYQYLTENGQPYYIGKGKHNRINARHTHTVVPEPQFRQFIQTDMLESEAIELELMLIKQYGRKIDGGILDNIKTNQWACLSGWNHSETTKQKISEKNSGKVRTEEHKHNYSTAKQNMSTETKEKIRNANLGKTGHWAGKTMPTKGKPWTQARRDAYLKSKGVLN